MYLASPKSPSLSSPKDEKDCTFMIKENVSGFDISVYNSSTVAEVNCLNKFIDQ